MSTARYVTAHAYRHDAYAALAIYRLHIFQGVRYSARVSTHSWWEAVFGKNARVMFAFFVFLIPSASRFAF